MNDHLPPPHDLDAERAVLAAAILHPVTLGEFAWLVPEDFYDPRHRILYRGVQELEGGGSKLDSVTLGRRLQDSGQLSQAGGIEYLHRILDGSPSLANVVDHAEIVAAAARIRALQGVCRALIAEGYGAIGGARDWLQRAEARLFEATQYRDDRETMSVLDEMISAELAAMEERRRSHSKIAGIPTGLRALDRRIGGLKRGNKYTLAGRPGMGKTGAAWTIARAVADSVRGPGLGVVFVSIEMPRPQMACRAIAQETCIDTITLERGELSQRQHSAVTTAAQVLSRLPIVVDDAGTQTVASIRSAVRRGVQRLRRKFGDGVELGLIVIDHFNIETPLTARGKNRENEMSEISNGNRKIAKEFDVPVLELMQLNRECERRPDKRPMLSDLRETGAAEQDSFCVIMLYRDDQYRNTTDKDADDFVEPTGVAELIVRKCRHGGRTGTVKVAFEPHTVRLYDLEQDREPEPPDGFEDAHAELDEWQANY